MDKYIVKISSIEKVTHDVVRITTEKPGNYLFVPGQATEVAINKSGWQTKRRPFSFTNLPSHNYLEFIIKTYPKHQGVTNELLQLKEHDELIIHDVFGAITYTNEGIFIAGGAGITPFISIFRFLQSTNKIGNNQLLFANKTKADIILEDEFKQLLGNAFVNILSDEKVDEYNYGMISEEFLKANIRNFNQQFYVCGPPPMMNMVTDLLTRLGVGKKAITVEI